MLNLRLKFSKNFCKQMENFKRGMDRLTDVRQEMNAMHERSEKLKVRHFRIYSFRGRYLGTHLIC